MRESRFTPEWADWACAWRRMGMRRRAIARGIRHFGQR